MKPPRILKRWAFLYRQRNGRPWLVRGAANPLKARLYRDRLLERGYLCGDILPIFLPVPAPKARPVTSGWPDFKRVK